MKKATITEAKAAKEIDVAIIDDTDRKLFATLQARAALRGHTLRKTPSGYVISSWTHSRHTDELATVVALLERMGC